MVLVYAILALLIGVAFSTQAPINAAASRVLGSPLSAALLSILISLISLVLVMGLLNPGWNFGKVRLLPWWVVFGGLVGVFMVAGAAFIVPVTGVTLFFVFLVAGQLLGAALLDQIGAFGVVPRSVSMIRVLGLLLVLGGALLIHLEKRM